MLLYLLYIEEYFNSNSYQKKKKSLSSWTETKIYAGKFTVGAGVAIVLGIYKQVSL